mgnify:CR=1 FL=1
MRGRKLRKYAALLDLCLFHSKKPSLNPLLNLFGIESIGLFTIMVVKVTMMLVQLGKVKWLTVSLKLFVTYFITTVIGQFYFGVIVLLSLVCECYNPHLSFLVLFLGAYVLLVLVLDDWLSRRFLLRYFPSSKIRKASLRTNLLVYAIAITILIISLDL